MLSWKVESQAFTEAVVGECGQWRWRGVGEEPTDRGARWETAGVKTGEVVEVREVRLSDANRYVLGVAFRGIG